MTEQEWLTCTEPRKMLEFFSSDSRFSERKARLFAVACGRRVWAWMTDERSRRAVEVCEQYADGRVGQKAVNAARREAFAASKSPIPPSPSRVNDRATQHATFVALHICMNTRRHDRQEMAAAAADCATSLVFFVGTAEGWTERKAQCDLLRCMFGNAFRLTPALNATWLTPTVTALAQGIYDERAFDRMPILADALEEVGCDNADVLQHLRSEGPHVRGCWAIDLLLGRS